MSHRDMAGVGQQRQSARVKHIQPDSFPGLWLPSVVYWKS